MNAPSLTIGIEEEYQIIDPASGELKSYITQILEDGKMLLKEQIKAELHQSMVEVGTEICQTPAEARAELVKLRYFAGLTMPEADGDGLAAVMADVSDRPEAVEQRPIGR